MAITITIMERMNLGDSRGVLFKAVSTTSNNTVTAATLGLSNILAIAPAGGSGVVTWSGAARATTGTLITYANVTPSSGTLYGLAIGY